MAVDLLVAILVFLLVGGSIAWIWTNKAAESKEHLFELEMQQKAENTLDMLIRGPGQPNDWETTPVVSMDAIGLAKRDRVLDARKIDTFIELSKGEAHESLVAYYRFNEASGLTANDSSGKGHRGTLDPGPPDPSWSTDCTTATKEAGGTCLEFASQGQTYPLIEVAGIADFPSSAITVSFWVNAADSTASKTRTPISYAIADNDNEFVITNYDAFEVSVKGEVPVQCNVGVTVDEWKHFTFTWQNLDGQVKIYLNGVEQLIDPVPSIAAGQTITSDGTLVIGQEQDSVGGGFEQDEAFLGLIDDIAIFNTALSESDVQDIYDRGVGLGTYPEVKKKLGLGGYDFYFKLYDPTTGTTIRTADGEAIETGLTPIWEQVTIRRPVLFAYHRPGEDEIGEQSEHEAIAELTVFTGITLGIEGWEVCGNNILEAGEECDTYQLSGETCQTRGYPIGILRCTEECVFDESDCGYGVCGNDVKDGTDECDGDDLGIGVDCTSFGFGFGVLDCTAGCEYDTSGCYDCDETCNAVCSDPDCVGAQDPDCPTPLNPGCCGDGVKNGSEQCDDPDLGGATCQSLGYHFGTLACASNCTYSGCGNCDGVCNGSCTNPVCTVAQDPDCDGSCCGDGSCSGGETCSTCPADCGSCPPPPPPPPDCLELECICCECGLEECLPEANGNGGGEGCIYLPCNGNGAAAPPSASISGTWMLAGPNGSDKLNATWTLAPPANCEEGCPACGGECCYCPTEGGTA